MAENIVLADIGSEVCEPIGGIEGVLSWAKLSDFDTIVDPLDICGVDSATTFAELATIPAPGHTMVTGKKLFKLNFTSETGSIKSTQIGPRKGRLFQNELVVKVSGSEAEILGFSRYIKNKDLVVFVTEFGSGRVRQFGSKRLGAWVESQEAIVAAEIEGECSLTITIYDKQKWHAPIYLGTLDYTGA
jgi:hypothetical protein